MVRVQKCQRGFTLIEILIALLIGLFLLGALLTIVQANRAVYGDQSKLAQLQDSERMALSMMADVIQSAGYFPDPTHNDLDGTLTAVVPFAVGQSIYGTHSTTVGDTLSVRYMTAGGDNILNCSGLSNPVGGANTLYVNVFSITGGQLVCTMNGTAYYLVSGVPNSASNLGVTNLAILYGVNTSASTAANNVDTYLDASQMSAANWANVLTVLIKLTFTNPLYTGNPSSTQPATITIQRVVGVMNQLGPVQ